MNRWILLLFVACFSQAANAVLKIDITEGVEGATPIAIIPFQWSGTSRLTDSDISAIISSDLARSGNKTRASASNRSFIDARIEVENDVDPLLTEFIFDAQTSGGLLISVPEDNSAEMIDRIRTAGAEATCVIGHVEPRGEKAIRVRP